MAVYCLNENILQIPFYPLSFSSLDNLEWLEEFRFIDESSMNGFVDCNKHFGKHFTSYVSDVLNSGSITFDENFYLNHHIDVKNAYIKGKLESPMQHFFADGASEFRIASFFLKKSDDTDILFLFGSPMDLEMSVIQRGIHEDKQAIYFVSRITEYPQIAELAQFWKTVKKNESTRLFVFSDSWFFSDFIEIYSRNENT